MKSFRANLEHWGHKEGGDAFHGVRFLINEMTDAVERVPTQFIESLQFRWKRIGNR